MVDGMRRSTAISRTQPMMASRSCSAGSEIVSIGCPRVSPLAAISTSFGVCALPNLDGLKAKAGIGAGGHETGRQAATLCIGENTSGKQSGHHRAGDDDPQAWLPRMPRHACLDGPLWRLQVCGALCTGVRGSGCPLPGRMNGINRRIAQSPADD